MNFNTIMVALFLMIVVLPPVAGVFYAGTVMQDWESIRSIASLFQIVGVASLIVVICVKKRFFG